MKKSLMEEWLPVREIGRDASIEMAYKAVPAYIRHCRELKIGKSIGREFYDPKIRNLHPWFARRPCSVARAITLAAVLPAKISKEGFMKAVGWKDKPKAFLMEKYPPLLFYTDPDRDLIDELLLGLLGKNSDEIVVCDPMAGGGTIPLESLRLGFRSVAVEYNPVAYLVLKSTLEYPSLYGNKLAERVRDESKRLISYVRDTLGSFYPEDSEGYILARGIQCPNCTGQIPLLHEAGITRSAYLELKFDPSKKTFEASITKLPKRLPYKGEKRGQIICPYCSTRITRKQAYKLWTADHISILRELKEGVFNEDKILTTHVLLVKQTKQGYTICDERDISCFLEACKTLMKSFKEIEEYIPTSQIPPHNEVFAPIRGYGIQYWYELFNPRQLLAIATIVKYVRDRCRHLLSKGELGVGISVYLALGTSKVIDYNSIATTWKRGTIRDTIGRYAQGRKITYGEEYCEAIIPYRNLNWIYEPYPISQEKTEGGICPILSELCKRVENMGKRVSVIHGDCRFLSSILPNIPVDVINVDPPYFDQHIYSDVSEYFWQVFRITLDPLIEAGLLFKESNLVAWKPMSPLIPREGEMIARKSSVRPVQTFSKEWYRDQMSVFFKECFKVLGKDGILLTWFTHRSLEAWKAIISSLYAGGFYVTKTWPITSELLTRLVNRGSKSAFSKTLIIVSRKREEKEVSKTELKEYIMDRMEELCDVLTDTGATQRELRSFLQATAICAMTRIPPQDISDPVQYFESKLIPWAVKLADEMFPALYERFSGRRPIRTLENFL